MEAVVTNLNWFVQPIGENLTKPQLMEAISARVYCGRAVPRLSLRKKP